MCLRAITHILRRKVASGPATSPPRTGRFDIFSPPPGDSDVISQVERLSSNENKNRAKIISDSGCCFASVINYGLHGRLQSASATSLCQMRGTHQHGQAATQSQLLPVQR
jgi:hypothetical protein